MKTFTTDDRIEQFNRIMAPCMPHIIDQRVMEDLKEMGFFIAPAAINHHSNYEGGLFDHSFAVTKALLSLTKRLELKWGRPESPYLVGMFHDLCKTEDYYYDPDENMWKWNPHARPEHGLKSVWMVMPLLSHMSEAEYWGTGKVPFMGIPAGHLACGFPPHKSMTEEEAECIRWHMGAFDEKENWNGYGGAIEKFPNVLYTHTADMIAARVLGV